MPEAVRAGELFPNETECKKKHGGLHSTKSAGAVTWREKAKTARITLMVFRFECGLLKL